MPAIISVFDPENKFNNNALNLLEQHNRKQSENYYNENLNYFLYLNNYKSHFLPLLIIKKLFFA